MKLLSFIFEEEEKAEVKIEKLENKVLELKPIFLQTGNMEIKKKIQEINAEIYHLKQG